jgi:hypothetical protein
LTPPPWIRTSRALQRRRNSSLRVDSSPTSSCRGLSCGSRPAAALWFGTPLPVAIVSFFVLMAAQGVIVPNGGALASAEVPAHPGTGSAVLGFVQWVAAGLVAPLAGLGGEHTAVPVAVLMILGAGASMFGLLVVARGSHGHEIAATRHGGLTMSA